MTGSLPPPEALFGDQSLDQVIGAGPETAISSLFKRAKDYLERGDKHEAIKVFAEIAQKHDIESRYRLQAWHFLREAGARPPSHLERNVLGVVVEVGMDSGHDLLAAYTDKTARYYNYSGAGVVWERPNSSLDNPIEAVLIAARSIVQHIGPWDGARRPPPPAGHVRLNILTPSGLYFGEGSFDDLNQDSTARPLTQAALNLMRGLTSMVVPDGKSEKLIENQSAARAIAERYLEDLRETPREDIVITDVVEYPTCWVVGYNTRRYLETRDHNDSLAGGRIIINRASGIPRMGNSRELAEQQLDPPE